MVFNCVLIWSVDFCLVKDKVPGRNLISVQYLKLTMLQVLLLEWLTTANHAKPVGQFSSQGDE